MILTTDNKFLMGTTIFIATILLGTYIIVDYVLTRNITHTETVLSSKIENFDKQLDSKASNFTVLDKIDATFERIDSKFDANQVILLDIQKKLTK